MATLDPSYEQIAARAYAIWQERGQPAGHDREIWFEAERRLRSAQAAAKGHGPVGKLPSPPERTRVRAMPPIDEAAMPGERMS